MSYGYKNKEMEKKKCVWCSLNSFNFLKRSLNFSLNSFHLYMNFMYEYVYSYKWIH